MALMDQTRKQLRQRIATILDDITEVTATANGTTTTIIDTFNVNTGAESYDGCEILFTSGSNDGKVSRVTGTAPTTGTLTFAPARTSTAADDTAELYNRRGRGFRVQDYHRAINQAIEEYQGIALLPTIETIGTAFDADTGTIAVPASLLEVYRVEYQDRDQLWNEIRRARPNGGFGWTAEPEDAVIRIEGDPAWEADGYTVRLHGYERHAALSTDASVITMDSTVIVYTAAAQLCLAGVGRDPRFASLAITLEQKKMAATSRVRNVRDPGTVRVRI